MCHFYELEKPQSLVDNDIKLSKLKTDTKSIVLFSEHLEPTLPEPLLTVKIG